MTSHALFYVLGLCPGDIYVWMADVSVDRTSGIVGGNTNFKLLSISLLGLLLFDL